ncbi:molybdopterin-dependent oxidoreductase [Thermodesulfobacteriota bacterium]
MASLNEKAIPTACGFCHHRCGIIAYVSNGVIRRIKANPNHLATKGDICPKGVAAGGVVHSPDRLKYPLRRTKSGFQRISWDEALDIMATRLLEIKAKYGAEALIKYEGNPVTEAVRDGFSQLVAAYGSSNFINPGHLCHTSRHIAFSTVYGGKGNPDYNNSRCILVWGSNPADSRQWGDMGASYGRCTRLIPEAKRRGAKLIVIDPRRTKLVDMADKWLVIEPGRDDALALAMLNVIVKERLYDAEFVDKWTVGFGRLVEHVERFTPEWAEKITKLKASDIRKVARLYATTKPALTRVGGGIDMYPNVVQTGRAIAILCAITGNLDVEGGDVFFPSPKLAPLLSNRPAVKLLSDDKYPLSPMVPFPNFVDAIFRGEPYKPRAMIVYHGNPALTNADSTKTRQALEKLEFLVVCDIFKTATAELADIILPDTSIFERYGFQCYCGAEGGVIALRQKVVEPIGEARPVFEIEYELAKRMGLDGAYPWTNTEEWINHRLRASGVTLDDLKKQPVICVTPPMEYRKYLKDGFNTLSGKVEIYSQRLEDHGYPPLPEYRELDAAFASQAGLLESYPLIGTTRRPGIYVLTKFRNIPALRKKEPEPLIRLCPEDAQRRGIVDGDLTAVRSPKGKITIKARVTDEVSPGVVIIDFGWGNPRDQGADVNLLTSDEERDPVSCATPNRRFRCQVTRADGKRDNR